MHDPFWKANIQAQIRPKSSSNFDGMNLAAALTKRVQCMRGGAHLSVQLDLFKKQEQGRLSALNLQQLLGLAADSLNPNI